MAIARAYLIQGRVQGVGFRWWASREARRLGLAGTVRNRPDGSVELFAYGLPSALLELEAMLGDGPSAARVDHVTPLPARDDLPPEFRILA